MQKMTMKNLAEFLEKIQAQLAVLSERVERLETGPAQPPAIEPVLEVPSIQATPPPEPEKSKITEEELLAISAAIAAYLGVRVHIRQIRLLSSRTWAQQGRVSVQASHNVHN